MGKSRIVLILLLIAARSLHRAHGTAGDAQNVFLALCNVWRIAKSGSIPAFTTPPDETDYKDILYYNMSAADDKWHALLDTAAPAGTWDKMKVTLGAQQKHFDWTGKWEEWQRQRQHTKPGAKDSNWAKENPRPISREERARAARALNLTAHIAQQINEQLKAPPTKDGIDLIKKINSALQEAMCGAETKYKFEASTNTCKKVAPALTKATDCAKGENGKSIGNDLVCICADGTDNACGARGADTYAKGDSTNDRIEGTAGTCPEKAAVQHLDSEISAAIAQIGALMAQQTQSTSKTVLGKENSASCTDSGANCVDYHTYFSGPDGGLNKVPWIKKLKEAANHYKLYEADKQKRIRLKEQLAALKKAAEYEYNTKGQAEPSTIPVQSTTATASKEIACESFNNNETHCPTDSCEYDKTKKECKAKPGSESTAAGTGEKPKEGPSLTGCARHGTKAECDADKKDDKQNCAWRKGKEGEDEKDTEKCRNGSFLLNKKSSISTDAAFMSLVSFYI
uniref:Variant surface glycoprotein (VSG), putative n=1 Tax=Trypanosoma brucei brucei (strain 927/4 GUTat10.1) TaxID=185431 RepID=Q4FKU7_TRYB2|nr:variant surface glycoprotein (VSG), putative [Trypanosoma brucei brucei TREU927]